MIFGKFNKFIDQFNSFKTAKLGVTVPESFNKDIQTGIQGLKRYNDLLKENKSIEAEQYRATMSSAQLQALDTSKDGDIKTASKNYTSIMQGSYVQDLASTKSLTNTRALIQEYNKLGDGTSKLQMTQQQFVNSVNQSNTGLGKYLANLKQGQANLIGYGVAAGAAKAKMLALQVVSATAWALIGVAISVAVSAIVSAIDDWIHADERAAEEAEEALTKYKEAQEELKRQREFLDDTDTLNKYERLARGVNALGQNISLSADEYKEYNDICNKIADLFPSLVKGHDEVGNAILKEKGNVDALTKAYKDSKDNAEKKLVDKRESTYKTLKNQLGLGEQTHTTTTKTKAVNGQAKTVQEDVYGYSLSDEDNKDILAKRNILNTISKYLKSEDNNQKLLQQFLGWDTIGSLSTKDFVNSKVGQELLKGLKLSKEFFVNAYSDVRGEIVDFLEDEQLYEGGTFNSDISFKNLQNNAGLVESALSDYQRKVQTAISNTRETTIAFLHQNISAYKDGTVETRAILDDIVENLDEDFYKEKTRAQIESAITYIADAFEGEDVQKKYQLVVDTQTKFNNGEIKYSEWIEKVKALYKLFDEKNDKDGTIRRTLRLMYSLDESGTNTTDYDKAKEKLYAMDGEGENFRRDTEAGKKFTEDFLGNLTNEQLQWINDNNIQTLYTDYINKHKKAGKYEISQWLVRAINRGIDDAKNKTKKLSITDLFGKLDDAKDGLSAIQKAAKSLKDDGTVGFSNLKDIAEQFKGVKFDNGKSLDDYIAKLATLKKNSKEYSAIATELIVSYVKSKVEVQNLTKENKNYVESLLKENGVKNASAVTNHILAESSLENAINTKDSTNKTWDNIQALYAEANGGKISAKALKGLHQIKELINNRHLILDTDVNELNKVTLSAYKAVLALEDYEKLQHFVNIQNNNNNELSMKDKDLKKTQGYKDFKNNSHLVAQYGTYKNYLKEQNKFLEKQITDLQNKADKKYDKKIAKLKKQLNQDLTTIAKIDPGGSKGSKSKGSKKDKYKTELENLKKRYDADEITLDTYIKELAKLKKKAKKGSDAYYDIIKELNSAKREKLDNQYNNGQISQEQYIKGLKKLLNTMRPTTEAYKKLLEEIRSNQRELWKTQYDNQKISADKYINKLKKQQGYYRKNSKQWLEIENEIYNARKDRLEKYNSKQDYLLKTDQISEKKYYARKLKKAKEFYELDKKGKEEYEKAIEESYDFLKEQRKKDYEDEKEKLEKKKEAIEEFYDKQKELLEKQKDTDDYLSDQTEKRKTVNELRQELARLSNDTSEVAKKRIAEVRKELEDAQKELIDFEKDHAYDATIKFLDKQKENTVKQIDNKIEEIDKSIKKLDEYSKNTYTLLYNWGKKKYPDVVKNLPSDPTKYASGTSSSVGGNVITQEQGSEVVGINKKNGFTLLTPESMVWSNEQTKRLWELSKNANLSKNFLPKPVGTNINQNSQVNITISDGAVKIEGNADRTTIQNAGKDLAYEILKEFKRYKN